MVLWIVIAVVLIRGIGAIAGGGESARAPEAVGAGAGFPDAEARVFAARFAAAYLDASAGGTGRGHGRRVAGFLSEGLSDRAMPVVSRRILGARVAWAMVARKQALGASRALITVATTSHDGQPAAKNSKPKCPPTRKALLQSLIEEIRVVNRGEIYPFFFLPVVRPPLRSVAPGGYKSNLVARIPGDRISLGKSGI